MSTQEGKMYLREFERYYSSDREGLTDDFKFTKRIKYSRDRQGNVSTQFEISRVIKEKQPQATRGHLWWKKKYTPKAIKKTVLYWYTADMFEWRYKPDEVIYGCET